MGGTISGGSEGTSREVSECVAPWKPSQASVLKEREREVGSKAEGSK